MTFTLAGERIMRVETDIPTESIENTLKAFPRPAAVIDLRVMLAQDSTGDDALWVWLMVEPGSASQRSQREQLLAFKQHIQAEVSKCMPSLWTYVRLENPPEQTHQQQP